MQHLSDGAQLAAHQQQLAGALIAPLAALIATLAAPGQVRELWLAAGGPGLALGVACAPALDAPDRARLEAFAAAQGAVLHLGLIAAHGEEPQWTEAGPPLRYATAPDGPVLEFQPWHFTQANRGVNRALIAAVLAQLAPGPDDRVLDLFCGLGNFTLPLATRQRWPAMPPCSAPAGPGRSRTPVSSACSRRPRTSNRWRSSAVWPRGRGSARLVRNQNRTPNVWKST